MRTLKLNVKPAISTSYYQQQNGYKPSGRSSWCFKVRCISHKVVTNVRTGKPYIWDMVSEDVQFVVTPLLTFTEAKAYIVRTARAHIGDLNVSNRRGKVTACTCIVMP